MHLYQGEDINAANTHFTRTSASVSNGVITITRKIYFESDGMNEGPVDIARLEMFPKMYSAHPLYSNYKYYGNANIDSVINTPERSVWCAELEYSTTNSNATDDEGDPVTSETPPWKLRPDNISFSYPEVVIPFDVAYKEDGTTLYAVNVSKDDLPLVTGKRVTNSAGDPLVLTRSVHNIQINFTYAVKEWNIKNLFDYGDTINSSDIDVCGIKIPAFQALLLPLSPTHIRVYKDDGSLKWEYWSIDVSIQVDMTGHLLYRKVLNVGNRAKFDDLDLSDDPILIAAKAYEPEIRTKFKGTGDDVSQICRFRKSEKQGAKYTMGENVFCSWNQYLQVRSAYNKAVNTLRGRQIYPDSSFADLGCEQLTQMPLNQQGYLLGEAVPGYNQGEKKYDPEAKYQYIVLREHPVKSWESLNFPKKGINW